MNESGATVEVGFPLVAAKIEAPSPISGATMVQLLPNVPSYLVKVPPVVPKRVSTLRTFLIATALPIFRVYDPGAYVIRYLTETASERLIFGGEEMDDFFEWPSVVEVIPHRSTLWLSADRPVPLLGARQPFVSPAGLHLQED